ncbi:MAG TPA: hypothetical protein VLH79_16050 [Chthonomonadales bacterium]|nr:hypothetical protein [Chthonomonadales bacterium]
MRTAFGCAGALLSLTPLAALGSPEGAYVAERSVRDDRGSTTLRFALQLERGGRAEMITEAVGRRPQVSRDTLARYGEVLHYVARRGRAIHTGAWTERRGRVELDMDRIEGDRAGGRWVVEAARHEVVLRGLDRRLYGEGEMRLRPRFGGGVDWGPEARRPHEVAGDYAITRRWRDTRTEHAVRTVISLRRDGRAELRTELLAGDPSADQDARRELGDIVRLLDRTRSVTHEGEWEADGGRVTLRMERLQSGPRTGAFLADWRPGMLRLRDFDRRLYGPMRHELRLGGRVVDLGGARVGGRDAGWGRPVSAADFAGAWRARLSVPGGRGYVDRVLELRPGGEATMTSELVSEGARIRVAQSRALGRLFERMADRRPLVHRGRWTVDGSFADVVLTDLRGERVTSRFRFGLGTQSLFATVWDHDLYGSERSLFAPVR